MKEQRQEHGCQTCKGTANKGRYNCACNSSSVIIFIQSVDLIDSVNMCIMSSEQWHTSSICTSEDVVVRR